MIPNSHCALYILSLSFYAGNSPEGHGRRRSGNNEVVLATSLTPALIGREKTICPLQRTTTPLNAYISLRTGTISQPSILGFWVELLAERRAPLRLVSAILRLRSLAFSLTIGLWTSSILASRFRVCLCLINHISAQAALIIFLKFPTLLDGAALSSVYLELSDFFPSAASLIQVSYLIYT